MNEPQRPSEGEENAPGAGPGDGIAIYSLMRAGDTFEDMAQQLFEMVRQMALAHPGAPRHLYLDIDGHRSPDGGYDFDAFELQAHFIVGFLAQWLASFRLPLCAATNADQRDDLPEELTTLPGPSAGSREAGIQWAATQLESPVYDSQTQTWVEPK